MSGPIPVRGVAHRPGSPAQASDPARVAVARAPPLSCRRRERSLTVDRVTATTIDGFPVEDDLRCVLLTAATLAGSSSVGVIHLEYGWDRTVQGILPAWSDRIACDADASRVVRRALALARAEGVPRATAGHLRIALNSWARRYGLAPAMLAQVRARIVAGEGGIEPAVNLHNRDCSTGDSDLPPVSDSPIAA